MRPLGSPGTRFGARNPIVSGFLRNVTFLSVRSLQTAAGEEVDPSPATVSGRDKQTAVVFLSFFSFLSFLPPEFLSFFLGERPRSRC